MDTAFKKVRDTLIKGDGLTSSDRKIVKEEIKRLKASNDARASAKILCCKIALNGSEKYNLTNQQLKHIMSNAGIESTDAIMKRSMELNSLAESDSLVGIVLTENNRMINMLLQKTDLEPAVKQVLANRIQKCLVMQLIKGKIFAPGTTRVLSDIVSNLNGDLAKRVVEASDTVPSTELKTKKQREVFIALHPDLTRKVGDKNFQKKFKKGEIDYSALVHNRIPTDFLKEIISNLWHLIPERYYDTRVYLAAKSAFGLSLDADTFPAGIPVIPEKDIMAARIEPTLEGFAVELKENKKVGPDVPEKYRELVDCWTDRCIMLGIMEAITFFKTRDGDIKAEESFVKLSLKPLNASSLK